MQKAEVILVPESCRDNGESKLTLDANSLHPSERIQERRIVELLRHINFLHCNRTCTMKKTELVLVPDLRRDHSESKLILGRDFAASILSGTRISNRKVALLDRIPELQSHLHNAKKHN